MLRLAKEMMGLDDLRDRDLEKALEFDIGRGILFGPWTDHEPKFFYCAARRSAEGGRSLRASHWATPYSGPTEA